MSPNLLKVLLHLGSILSILKDGEACVQDLLKGQTARADFDKVLADVSSLLSSGIINVPGIVAGDAAGILAQLKAALG